MENYGHRRRAEAKKESDDSKGTGREIAHAVNLDVPGCIVRGEGRSIREPKALGGYKLLSGVPLTVKKMPLGGGGGWGDSDPLV